MTEEQINKINDRLNRHERRLDRQQRRIEALESAPTEPEPTPDPVPDPVPPPPPVGQITPMPPQPAALQYQPGTSGRAYAKPGGLVIAGRDNYNEQTMKDVSAGGGTVLIYIDPIIDNAHGRYASMLLSASEFGGQVPRWGNYMPNEWGYLTDFRPGSLLQRKLEPVLERMVSENPHMGGFFVDDLGSRSWFPNLSWGGFPEKQAWRDGAIEIAKTFRRVCDRHGLIFIVNGTWQAGDLGGGGGGYPDMGQHGCSLAEGGYVENHDGQISFFGPYGAAQQWANDSKVTGGKAFNYAAVRTSAGLREYVDSGAYAYVALQPDYGVAPAPWGSFHPTGLPSRVAR